MESFFLSLLPDGKSGPGPGSHLVLRTSKRRTDVCGFLFTFLLFLHFFLTGGATQPNLLVHHITRVKVPRVFYSSVERYQKMRM